MLEKQMFMKLVGMQLSSISEGNVEVQLEIGDEHQQQNGLIHGGVITTAADVAMGFAAMSLVGEDDLVVTGEIKVSFLNPGTGNRLVSEGVVLKPGRRVNFCEAQIYSISGSEKTLIAKASSSMITISESDLDR